MISSILFSVIPEYFRTQPVKRAYLFGSQLSDHPDESSDIDILVELDHSKPIGLRFIRMKLELEDLLHKKVDLLSVEAVSEFILPHIEKNKRLIYERSAER